MKNITACLILLLLCSSAFGQWKAQTAETFDKTYRIAFVTSKGGNETLRVLRNITSAPKQKVANPYDQIAWQILLNNKLDKGYKVQSLVFSFDDSPKIYINQSSAFKQEWDASSKRYIIESTGQIWRLGDKRDKEIRKISDPESLPQSERANTKSILELLKAGQKVYCQIILLDEVYGTQSNISCEFTLQNSTKSINYLFR